MTSTNDIRRGFLDYFGSEGHQIVPSAPLVPQNDPTLMFVNAGMVPFKNVFTGLESRPYTTATSSQKCVRAGGKHNDLDNVGYTARHHTFFEMLGNFSFGDYFKEQAITHAWTLLTKVWGIPAEKLTATVYHTDDEAFDLWKKIAGLPDHKIIRIPTKDNFWAMGENGPCGPCSEIFYDHGDHIYGGPPGSPEEDGDRFVEIWNLVFMQFEQEANEIIGELPKKSIDTGMGLERIAAVLQGVHDNYDTDTFKALIAASCELTHTKAEDGQKASHRVIADHLRSAGFLVADGVLPANEGRGYVLRRIMRRAMRHGRILGLMEPFLWQVAGTVADMMGAVYPELAETCGLGSLDAVAIDYAFEGVPATLPAGTTIVTLDNQSAAGEFHELTMARINDGVSETVEQILAMSDTDAAARVSLAASASAEVGEIGGATIDLVPGRYLYACFVPMGSIGAQEGTGDPHYLSGMYGEFTVA